MVSIRLRPTIAADLPFVLGAEHHPENRAFVLPWTADQHAAALRDPDLAHCILSDDEDRAVGFVLLAGLVSPHRSIEFRRLVITRKNFGFGRAAVRKIKSHAFRTLNAHRLWLDVKEHNTRARRLYESEGFSMEGVLRECLRAESGYESLVVMSILASEYRQDT